jgi:hypothetical protein
MQPAATKVGRIKAVRRAYFDFLAEQPDALRLMMQELVVGGAPPAVALTRPPVVRPSRP